MEVIICLFFDPTSPGADVAFPSPVLGLCFIEITEEPIPRDVPVPCGVHVLMTCFVVASYAPTKVTLRSHTGIFIKLNCAPIAWYSNGKYCLVIDFQSRICFPSNRHRYVSRFALKIAYLQY